MLVFTSDGGSRSDSSSQGCEFRDIRSGHRNYCLVRLEDELTEVSVYVRWIGSSGEESPVEAHLICDGLESPDPVG